MRYILKYQNFNESKGISESSEIVTDSIWNKIESDITNLTSSSNKFNFNEKDFKLKDIEIEYIITKNNENICNAITQLKDSIIEDKYIKNVKITINIKYNILDEPFLYYIKSVLFHEILHVFQHYNLILDNKFRPESFSIGSIIPQLKNSIKSKYVSYILDVLYYSLSHELSAQIHQYYMYKKENKEYKKIEIIKNILENFLIKQDLTEEENLELDFLKNHILNSIKFYTTNKNYNKDILNSLWNENNNIKFLNKLSNIIKNKLKWIDRKIKLINSKINDIKYDETFTYYGDLKDYKYIEFFEFIRKNLNDCTQYDYI